MAFHKVNKIIILRIKPASSIRFKKDLHSAVNSANASKKSNFKITPRRLKPLRKNQPHPLDFSTKKSLSSYIPDPMTKVRSLAGQSLVTDFKRGWLDLSILHFDKVKDVTNKIKGDLISVDDVVKELISFKPNEYSQDITDKKNQLKEKLTSNIRKIRYDEKEDDYEEFGNYEKAGSIRKYPKSFQSDYGEIIKKRLKNQSDFDDGMIYSKRDDDFNNETDKELSSETEESSIDYVPRKKNPRKYFEEEAVDTDSNKISFRLDLLPVDQNTRELIGFKSHEKVTIEELAEINRLGGRIDNIDSLLKKRIKPYKPNHEKWETRNPYEKKSKFKRGNYDENQLEDGAAYDRNRNPIKFKKYEKSPEKIAKFKKFEEFEEVSEHDVPNKRTLRKKTDDSIYFPSYEEYERAQKYYKDT